MARVRPSAASGGHGCDADVAGVVGCWLDAVEFVVGCSVMMEARIA